MIISVKLLGTHRSKLPPGSKTNTCQIDVPAGTIVRQIVEQFDITYDDNNIVLLNGHVPDPDKNLESGDEICIFSALAGG